MKKKDIKKRIKELSDRVKNEEGYNEEEEMEKLDETRDEIVKNIKEMSNFFNKKEKVKLEKNKVFKNIRHIVDLMEKSMTEGVSISEKMEIMNYVPMYLPLALSVIVGQILDLEQFEDTNDFWGIILGGYIGEDKHPLSLIQTLAFNLVGKDNELRDEQVEELIKRLK